MAGEVGELKAVARNNCHQIQIHGHRGARGLFPENSLIAIKAGIESGCDAIEVDLCVTADNYLVIHHDLKLSPHLVRDASGQWVTDKIRIRDKTLEQIKTYDIGRLNPDSGYAAQFRMQEAVDGTRIPTLDEFVALVKEYDSKVIYNLELKKADDPQDTPALPEYVDLVIKALKKHNIVRRVFLQSFDRQLIIAAKFRLPELKIGWITKPKPSGILLPSMRESRFDSRLESMVIKGIDVWSSHQQGLNADNVRVAHGLGLQVYTWTVNTKEDMQRMIDLSVDAITTDYPDRLFALLKRTGYR